MQWNDFSKVKPVKTGLYLVVIGRGAVDLADYEVSTGKWKRHYNATVLQLAVTHWMELPAFP